MSARMYMQSFVALRCVLRKPIFGLQWLFTRDSIYAIARLCDSDVSVCLSVCLSHAGIVPSGAKAGS